MKKPSEEELLNARRIARAVCAAAGEPDRLEAVLSPCRASPRDARLRWVCAFLYGELEGANRTVIARAFQLDRTWTKWALRHLAALYGTSPEYNNITDRARAILLDGN